MIIFEQKDKILTSKYFHGAGCKEATLKQGLNINEVIDYSTTINWKATEFFPNASNFNMQTITEYPDINYNKLSNLIENTYQLPQNYFTLTNGANEAISSLFQYFNLQGYHNSKQVAFIDSVYSEYYKFANINKFKSVQYDSKKTEFDINKLHEKIIIVVNPNTPFGYYTDLSNTLDSLLQQNSILIIDESFLDYIDKPSLTTLIKDYSNLYIIKSLTKFYGSPGARLGLIINKNFTKNNFSELIPPWQISAYDNWFYLSQITEYNNIKTETLKWVKDESTKLKETVSKLENITIFNNSETSYHTLELKPEFVKANKIDDLQKFFLKKYHVYIRPTADFYGCSNTSFRVGLRLSKDNELFFNTLKDIG